MNTKGGRCILTGHYLWRYDDEIVRLVQRGDMNAGQGEENIQIQRIAKAREELEEVKKKKKNANEG